MSTIRLSYRSILRTVLVPLVALAVALGGIEHPAGAATLKPHTNSSTIQLYDPQGGWSIGHMISVDTSTLPAPYDQYAQVTAWYYTCTTNTAADPSKSSDCQLRLNFSSAYLLDYDDSGKYLVANIEVYDMMSQTHETFTTQYSALIGPYSDPCTSGTVCNVTVSSVNWSTLRLNWDAPNMSMMGGASVGGYIVKKMSNINDFTGTTVCTVTDPTIRYCDVEYSSGNGSFNSGVNYYKIIPRVGGGGSYMDGPSMSVNLQGGYQPAISASVSSNSVFIYAMPQMGYRVNGWDTYGWQWTVDGKTCQITMGSTLNWTPTPSQDCASWTPTVGFWNNSFASVMPLSPDTTYAFTGSAEYQMQLTTQYGSYGSGGGSMRTIFPDISFNFSVKTLAEERPNPSNFSVSANSDGTYTTSYDAPAGTAPDGYNILGYDADGGIHGGYCASGDVTTGSTTTCSDLTIYSGGPGSAPVTITSWTLSAIWMETSRLTVGAPDATQSTLFNSQASYQMGVGRGWVQITSGSWIKSDGTSSSNPNGNGGGSGGGGGSSTTAPGAPTGVSATAGDGQATVSWTAPSSTGGASITGYTVQYSSDGGSTWNTASCSGTSTSCTVTGLTNGSNYVFKVAATNSAGTGSYSSNSSSVSPAASGGGGGGGGGGGSSNTAPGAPSGVNTTATDTSVTVSWTAPTNNGGSSITGYTVTITDGSGNVFGTCTTTTATSCTVSPLTPGASYTATVVANNAQGAGTSATKSFSATNTAGKKAKRYYIRRYQKGQLSVKAKQIKQIKKAVTAIVKSGATTIRITGWTNPGAKKIKSTTRAVNVTKVVNKQLKTLKATNIQVTTVGAGGTKRFGGTVLNRVVVIRGK